MSYKDYSFIKENKKNVNFTIKSAYIAIKSDQGHVHIPDYLQSRACTRRSKETQLCMFTDTHKVWELNMP